MKHNKYSIYYDHVGYTLKEWEVPEEVPVDPKLGVENYELMEWGIKHGVFELIPIADYVETEFGVEPVDKNGDTFDERCVEASAFSNEFEEYMIPFYEFGIEEAGRSPYCHTLDTLINAKPNIRSYEADKVIH